MKNYHDMLLKIMESPLEDLNQRTGKMCRLIVGHQLQYDMREGFPALTTRKIPFKNAVGELCGFWRGCDSAAQFRELGCHFWDQNANETAAWLANPHRIGKHDYLGRVYGKQWTDWADRRVVESQAECDGLLARGYACRMHDEKQHLWLMERSINQLEDAVRTIMTNPSDRRIIITGWRPDEFDMMALPPCHMDYRFVPLQREKVLNVVMTIRSWDVFLGANIVLTALFLETMARLTGYIAGTVTIQATNAHIYEDHFEQVKELLTREHFPMPRLHISDNVKQLASINEIPGVFSRIEPSDFSMIGYQSHGIIKAPMAA
jgi:thymidylate synthase